MAECWEISPDATTFTFHLRKDIKWHDGTPFTAKDVVYTATWAAENRNAFVGFPPAWFSLKDQATPEKACTDAGPHRRREVRRHGDVRRRQRRPTTTRSCSRSRRRTSSSCARWSTRPSVIMPEHLLEGQTLDQINKGDFKNKSPIGTGPFKFKEIVPDQFISFEANPDYYGGRPKLDTALLQGRSQPETALAQLESGELDAALNVGATNADPLSDGRHPQRPDRQLAGHLHAGPDRRHATQTRRGGTSRSSSTSRR